MFPPKPDKQTDRQTYGWTDLSIHRVASLLKRMARFMIAKLKRTDGINKCRVIVHKILFLSKPLIYVMLMSLKS